MKKLFFYTSLLALMAFGTSNHIAVAAKGKRKVSAKKAKNQQKRDKKSGSRRARNAMRKHRRKHRRDRALIKDLIKEKVPDNEEMLDNEKPSKKSDKTKRSGTNITPQIVIPSITQINPPQKRQ